MVEQNELLTKREKEILKLIEIGMTNKEISVALVISIPTVQNHIESILSKYSIHDRKKLIVDRYKND